MVIEAHELAVDLGDQPVLRGVSLTLAPGTITALIGPPRGGKTTLLRALAGLVPPRHGNVAMDGATLDGHDAEALVRWQRHVGMAFQNDALFDALTVYENVALPLEQRGLAPDVVRTRVLARLGDVGLADAIDKTPEQLSGGMRKRVGIARATVHEPKLGLFDDPIAGLDPLSGSRILGLIVRLTTESKMAAVVVSHELDLLLPIASHVVMLVGGDVVYDGTPDAIMRSSHLAVHQFVRGADDGPL